jgi:protein gp37
MGDLWDPGVNQAWRNAIWSAVRHNVQHYAQGGANTYLVLTKWAHVITQTDTDWFEECPHLWVGLSVDGLVPSLRPWLNLCNAVPAGSRFISLEPASPDGVFDLRAILSMDSKDHPDWLIVGPETPRYKHLGDPGEAQIVELISEARGLGIPVWAKASCVLAWPDVVGWSELPATMRYTEAQL